MFVNGIKKLTTNGLLFDNYSPGEILSWDIDILGISVDGLNRISYEKIRKNDNYNKLRKNIQKFYLAKIYNQKKYPITCIRNVIFPHYNPNQIEDFKKKWENVSDQITFNTLNTFTVNERKLRFSRCKEFFFNAEIRWDGSILLCQHQFIWGENEIIGNISDTSLKKIWQVERLKEIRLLHKKRNFPKHCRSCFNTATNNKGYRNSRKYNSSKSRIVTFIDIFFNVT